MRVRPFILSFLYVLIGVSYATAATTSWDTSPPIASAKATAAPTSRPLPPNHSILVAFRPGNSNIGKFSATLRYASTHAATRPATDVPFKTIVLKSAIDVEFTVDSSNTVITTVDREEHIVLGQPLIEASTIADSDDNLLLFVKNTHGVQTGQPGHRSASYCWFERNSGSGPSFVVTTVAGTQNPVYHVTAASSGITIVTRRKPLPVTSNGSILCP